MPYPREKASGMFTLLPHGEDAGDSCSTPFELWCEARDIHPDDSRAWPLYEASLASSPPQSPAQPVVSSPAAS